VRALLVSFVVGSSLLLGQGHDVVVPYIPPPTDNAALQDPVTRLVRRIAAGDASLAADPVRGVLPSLLSALRIPVSSQVLVFSKTSLQAEFIRPRTPRAIYFNDDVYVGFVPDGSVIEISAVDPDVGAVFYTLGRRAGARPTLVTGVRCVQCHQIPATLGVPGHVMRSVFVRADGRLASDEPTYLTDDRSPFEQRWGGWFVTGMLRGATHMGNAILPAGQRAPEFDRRPGSTMTDVDQLFDHDRYLTRESDVVALLVLGHQVRMHNLITRLRYSVMALPPAETQGWSRASPPPKHVSEQIEELLRYLLFVNEVPLPGPVESASSFAADFERTGRQDRRGRSLRQLDLKSRLFKYRCSYLIYSDAFLGLPAPAKLAVYGRLRDILAGNDTEPAFASLASAERTAIREILESTHPEFAAAK
jgi:hypothetical protein